MAANCRMLYWKPRGLLTWCICATVVLIVLVPMESFAESYGYDSASSCDPTRASRRGRSQLLKTIPCDLSVQAYCNLPGSAYPWHAVRRFVHENQGLMRRMYGDVRHISVLKEEFETNEIEIDDIDRATERYSRQQSFDGRERRVDGGKSMKYLRPSSPHQYEGLGPYMRDKSNEITFKEPHFRPAQLKSATTAKNVTPTMLRSSMLAAESLNTTTLATTTTTTTAIPTSIQTTEIPETTKKSTLTTTSKSTASTATVESPPRTVSIETSSSLTPSTTRLPSGKDDMPFLKEGVGEKNETQGTSSSEEVTVASENTKLLQDNVVEVDGIADLQTLNEETIDIEALSSLAKLETGETLSPVTGFEEKAISEDFVGGKISSTLKVSASGIQLTTEVPNVAAKLEGIESIVSKYPQDLHAGGTDEPSANSEVPVDTVAKENDPNGQISSSSTVQQQKIRFESVKGTVAGVGIPSSKKPISGEGQLFQDVAQKEPPVVNGRGVNACPVKEEVVAPFWANNTRGEVLALLNLYPFEQYVHWEKCTHELKQMYCREGCRCEQQYRLHRLLAYDPHNECRGIFSDWFRFPSCCICKCYDMPFDFRVTSRSPRSLTKESIEMMEDELQNAIYEHATDEWYRPKEYDFV